MDNASINVEDNDAKFTFLKSLYDYGKSLIKEMNKIFLEEKNPIEQKNKNLLAYL